VTGPSDRAVEAAENAYREYRRLGPLYTADAMPSMLAAAHDPALGEDASVNVAAVKAWLDRWARRGAVVYGLGDHFVREHREGRL
jgi:hypothetical protein